MSLKVNITKTWSDGRVINVLGTIAMSGENYATGGNVINWKNSAIKSGGVPLYVHMQVFSQTADRTYEYMYIASSKKIKVIAHADGAEFAAGAFSGTVTNNPPSFLAIFPKFK